MWFWWFMFGCDLLIPSVIIHFPLYKSSENTIGVAGGILCTIQCIILVVPVFFTERALKKNFTNEGIRKG